MTRRTGWWFLPLLALAGCDAAGYSLWLLTPRDEKKIEAEFGGLPKHSVAVIFFVDEKTQLEYPNVRLTLGARLADQIRKNIKTARVIDPFVVTRYQDENLHWDTQPKTKTAQELKVDYLLVVSLVEFGTRVPGQINSYQGRISAEAKLFDAQMGDGEDVLWRSKDELSVIHPKVPQYSPTVEPIIRQQVEEQFADLLAKKFYDHKVIVDVEGD
jgi:hypothetical protein